MRADSKPASDFYALTAASRPAIDDRQQRRLPDRRKFTWKTLAGMLLLPRRSGARRSESLHDQLVDLHEARLMWLCLGILLTSVADAGLALRYANMAPEKLSFAAQVLLAARPVSYTAVKVLGTGVGLVLLVAVSGLNVFRIVRIRTLLHGFFFAYLALVVSQIVLP